MTDTNSTDCQRFRPLLALIDLHRPKVEEYMAMYKVAENGCWEWTGKNKTPRRPGFPTQGKVALPAAPNLSAQRISYAFHTGIDPVEHPILQICSGTNCINPDHLRPIGKRIKIKKGDVFGRFTVLGESHADHLYRKHYFVRCECGVEKTCHGAAMASGNTQSCGCLSLEVARRNRKPSKGSELTAVINGYKRHAKARGYDWNLSRNEVRFLIGLSCAYCDSPPSNLKTTRHSIEPLKYSGIDRINNNLGYFIGNVAPCCSICNRAKMSAEYDEFAAWVSRLSGGSRKLLSSHDLGNAFAQQYGDYLLEQVA